MGTVILTKLDDEARVIVARLTGDPSGSQQWAGDELRYSVDGVSDEHAAQITGVQLYSCDAGWFEHLRLTPAAPDRRVGGR